MAISPWSLALIFCELRACWHDYSLLISREFTHTAEKYALAAWVRRHHEFVHPNLSTVAVEKSADTAANLWPTLKVGGWRIPVQFF